MWTLEEYIPHSVIVLRRRDLTWLESSYISWHSFIFPMNKNQFKELNSFESSAFVQILEFNNILFAKLVYDCFKAPHQDYIYIYIIMYIVGERKLCAKEKENIQCTYIKLRKLSNNNFRSKVVLVYEKKNISQLRQWITVQQFSCRLSLLKWSRVY